MKIKIIVTVFILVVIALGSSGCMDFLNANDKTITYESYPTEARYTITYGYKINCTGSGKYEINYDLDYPEILNGNILSTEIHEEGYQENILATYNNIITWNISSSASKEYNLTLTAHIDAKSFIVSDLNGANALDIQEINDQFPDIVAQYCQAQSNGTEVFIDPNNLEIKNIATGVLETAQTNSSFLVAKELFRWFKQNTAYKAHPPGDEEVQSALTTLNRQKGDCDDLSFLYISLCRSQGIPARFIRGFLLDASTVVHHEWVEVFVGGDLGNNGWVPVECAGTAEKVETEIYQNFGIENVEHLRLFTDDGSNESLSISLSGVSYRIFNENRDIGLKFESSIVNFSAIKSQQLVIQENGIRLYK